MESGDRIQKDDIETPPKGIRAEQGELRPRESTRESRKPTRLIEEK